MEGPHWRGDLRGRAVVHMMRVKMTWLLPPWCAPCGRSDSWVASYMAAEKEKSMRMRRKACSYASGCAHLQAGVVVWDERAPDDIISNLKGRGSGSHDLRNQLCACVVHNVRAEPRHCERLFGVPVNKDQRRRYAARSAVAAGESGAAPAEAAAADEAAPLPLPLLPPPAAAA